MVLGVNATVTWTNNDTAAHTVTADNTSGGTAAFDSGNMPRARRSPTTSRRRALTVPLQLPLVDERDGGGQGGRAVHHDGQGVDPERPPGQHLVIGVNSTVTWTNNDIAAHTVTADNTTGGTAVFDSSNMAPGATFTYNFTAPGTYTYHCSYHAWMKGTVVVKAGGPSITTVKVSIPNGAGPRPGRLATPPTPSLWSSG